MTEETTKSEDSSQNPKTENPSRGLGAERYWPCVLALVIAGIWCLLVKPDDRIEMMKELANPVVSVFAIGVGFLGASLSILMTASTRTIRRFNDSHGLNHLIGYHWSAIRLGLSACVLSLIALAAKHYHGPIQLTHLDTLWILVCVWAGGAFLRVLNVLTILLKRH